MKRASEEFKLSKRDIALIRATVNEVNKSRLKGDTERKIRQIERFGVRAKGGKINKKKK